MILLVHDLSSHNSLSSLNDLDSLTSQKKSQSFMFPSTMAPKRPILASQCEMYHQKPSILLIFSTHSLGGCRGHPTRPKLNLKDESQMSTPDEYTDNFKLNLICIFPSVGAKFKKPLCPRTPCS